MKKSIINRNYSLLVLVLLILYITYINIPNNIVMTGGAASSNPYESMDVDKLNQKLMKVSSLYMVLNKYFYVYIAVLVILVGLTIYYIYQHAQVEGMPGLVEPVIGWENEGGTFLSQYFVLDRHHKGLNAPGTTNLPDGPVPDWDKNSKDFITTVQAGVDLFCNIVAPCDICSCSGPDPKYAGDPKNAPTIPYGGPQCRPPVNIEKFIEHADGTTSTASVPNPANSIRQTADKLDFTHRIMGTIPTCCCHLFDSVGIDISNINKQSAVAFSKLGSDEANKVNGGELKELLAPFLESITDLNKKSRASALDNESYPIGLLPEVGCEPAATPAPLDTKDGPKVPHNGKYALAMFQACLSNKPITYKGKDITDPEGNVLEAGKPPADSTTPNEGKTPYDVNLTACGNNAYKNKIAIDRGHSINTIYRNNNYFNALKDIIKKAKDGNPVTTFDITPYIGVMPTETNSSYPWSGGAWPVAHEAFKGDSVTTEYFYMGKIGENPVKFELKIDNYLKEVYAYPVGPAETKNSNSTKEIKVNDTGGADATKFLNAGLIDKYINNTSSFFKGTYIFP